MPVVAVGGESPFLEATRELAARLRPGIVPEAAWRGLAENGRVLLAFTEEGDLAGYLVSCPIGNEARIVDLLVVPELRLLGHARDLLETLAHRSSQFVRITTAESGEGNFWSHLGFLPSPERGREGSNGTKLHVLARDLESTRHKWLHPIPPPVPFTLDAPVFFELVRGQSPLAADWLQDLITPHLPPDVKTAISRSEPPSQRIRLLQSLPKFAVLPESEAASKFEKQLQSVLSGSRPKPSRSSVRALAASLAAGHTVFFSRDTGLLAGSETLFSVLGIQVLRPEDVVANITSLLPEAAYQPHLVNGRGLEMAGELQRIVVNPTGTPVLSLKQNEDDLAFEINRDKAVSAPLLSTLARHFLSRVPEGRLQVRDAPPPLGPALRSEGLVERNGVWRTRRLGFVGSVEEFEQVLKEELPGPLEDLTALDQLELEKRFWPAQLLDGPLPVYILPVAPAVAQATWDEAMASQDLFWDASTVRTHREWVHVLSQPLSWLQAPAKVLWYVQPNPQYPGSGAIRASSLLLETSVNTSGVLARRYRRFGAFSEADLLLLARGDEDAELMALHCGWLHPFSRPLAIAGFGKLAEACGESPLIRAPRRVGPELAMRILLQSGAHSTDD